VDTCAFGPKESLVDSRWYLVKEISIAYIVLRRAKKRDLDADFARLAQIYADFFGGKRIDKRGGVKDNQLQKRHHGLVLRSDTSQSSINAD